MGLERAAAPKVVQIGVSRPPLEVDDLPTPEEVFHVPKIGFKEAVTRVIGPSLIALGISIGSGEWLLGPLNVGTYGFVGIGFIILQTFYNIEIGRYIMATGEVPILGFGRTPPGWKLWIPLSLFIIYFAFIWGGWAASAGQSLFVLLTGRIPQPADLPTVRLLAVALMGTVFVITLFGKKISRTLELVNWVMVGFILSTLIIVDLFFVPLSKWTEGIVGLLTPALPPRGTDATLIGGLAGFAAMASGLNWYALNYYRDKGYGMATRSASSPPWSAASRKKCFLRVKPFPKTKRTPASGGAGSGFWFWISGWSSSPGRFLACFCPPFWSPIWLRCLGWKSPRPQLSRLMRRTSSAASTTRSFPSGP